MDLGAGGREDAQLVAVERGSPTWLMDHMMVVVAQQHEVVEIGGPSVLPMDDVVGITPSGWLSASRISAPVVAHH